MLSAEALGAGLPWEPLSLAELPGQYWAPEAAKMDGTDLAGRKEPW